MAEKEKIKCCNCEVVYKNEEELKVLYDNKTKEYYRGCKICKTDKYLSDIE